MSITTCMNRECSGGFVKHVSSLTRLIPREFFAFKMVGWAEKLVERLPKFSKNHGVFYHVTHDKMLSSEVILVIGSQSCFAAMGNPISSGHFIMIHQTKYSMILEVFWQRCPRVSLLAQQFENREDR